MPLSSMTAFARAEGQTETRAWLWEVRSVNGRGLDVRCRLASGFEALEIAVRERIRKRFKRGNIAVTLTVTRTAGPGAVRINEGVLDQLIAIVPEIRRRVPDLRPPAADGLLALRGVIEAADEEPSEAVRAALEEALLASLDSVLEQLARMRAEEGARLAPVLAGHVERIEALSREAERLAAIQPAAILARLKEKLEALLAETPELPADRLAQEAALLATRADPREEIDRLKSHCEAARALLAAAGPAGRRLDFLCQEFNREANTLCAKSADTALTQLGLELKAVIDQLREQVQNIE